MHRCGVICWTGTRRCSWRSHWPVTRFRLYRASTLSSWNSPATTTPHWGTMSRLWRGIRLWGTMMRLAPVELLAWRYALETYDGNAHWFVHLLPPLQLSTVKRRILGLLDFHILHGSYQVDHVPSGPTNSATITTMHPLRSFVEKLSVMDTRGDCYSLRWLCVKNNSDVKNESPKTG